MKHITTILLIACSLSVFANNESSTEQNEFDDMSKTLELLKAEKYDLAFKGLLEYQKSLIQNDQFKFEVCLALFKVCEKYPQGRKELRTFCDNLTKSLSKKPCSLPKVKNLMVLSSFSGTIESTMPLFLKLSEGGEQGKLCAENMYSYHKPQLLEEKRYDLCYSFTNSPKEEFDKLVKSYQYNLDQALKRFPQSHPCNDKHEKNLQLNQMVTQLANLILIYNKTGHSSEASELESLFSSKFGLEPLAKFNALKKKIAQVEVNGIYTITFQTVVNKSNVKAKLVSFSDQSQRELYLLPKKDFSNKDFLKATVRPGYGDNSYEVLLKLTKDATVRFGKHTEKIKGQQMAILLNGKIVSTPYINCALYGGTVIISGDFSLEIASKIVNSINSQKPTKTPKGK